MGARVSAGPVWTSVLSRLHLPPAVTLDEPTIVDVPRLNPNAPPAITVALEATGWGPSLHRFLMDWKVECDPDAMAIATALQPLADLQWKRHTLALRHGMSGRILMDPGVLTHLAIDRLLIAAHPEILVRIETVARRFDTIGVIGDRTTIGRDGVTLSDPPDGMTCPETLVRVNTPWGWYDGESAVIKRRAARGIPDTVIAAMPGRRIGDLICGSDTFDKLAPLLDHTVTDAFVEDDTIRLMTQPDWVSIGEWLERH